MKLGYYPGCSMHGTAREFGESLQAVAPGIGLELDEVNDWSCCGSSSAHSTNHLLAIALPARNLAIAEAQGHEAVMAPCAACYNRLAGARHAAMHDADLAARLPGLIGRPFANKVQVLNIVQVLKDAAPAITAAAKKPLKDLKVACYYGCLLVRPAEVTGFDDTEAPTSMEAVVKACGATPVKWNMALECCGGGFSLSRTNSVVRMGRAILQDARKAGADAIAVACPMCHSNLDFRQGAMQARGEAPMPILYLTELIGMAMGLGEKALGTNRHFVSPRPVVDRLAAAAQPAAPAAEVV